MILTARMLVLREFFLRRGFMLDNVVLKRDDIEVLDIATHPPERVPLLKEA